MSELVYPIWPGSASVYSGSAADYTQFKFYDEDQLFLTESIQATEWAAKRLGYPVTDVELTNENFISMYEEAVTAYGAVLNEQNIKEYMLTVQGSSISTNLTGRTIRGGIGRIIELAEGYGAEVGVGGDVEWKHTSIDIIDGQQLYDLNVLLADVFESGSRIRIKRIFHDRTPASVRYFDPWGIPTSPGIYGMGSIYGFGSGGTIGAVGTSYVLRPVYEDILRMQAVEINDQVRKSGFSFELINNKLRIFPIPNAGFKLWIDYVNVADTDIGYVTGSNSVGGDRGLGNITDPSNIPYENLVYSNINSVGRKWIRDYFLALCKITLGGIRAKYPTIPIPNSEITLDGESLRNEGINERDKLMERLLDMLDKSGKKAQIANKQEEEENLQKIMNKVPMGIFVK